MGEGFLGFQGVGVIFMRWKVYLEVRQSSVQMLGSIGKNRATVKIVQSVADNRWPSIRIQFVYLGGPSVKKYPFLIFLLLIILQVMAGCSDNESVQMEDGGVEVNFSIVSPIAGFNYVLVSTKKIEVFRESEFFNSTSLLNAAGISNLGTDFDSKQLVFMAMGTQPSSGYAISAENVLDYGGYLRLNIVYSVPGIGCVEDDVLTQPNQLLEVDSRKDVIIHERYVARVCKRD